MYQQSELFYADALNFITGGVNSPVRAFKSVQRNPVFIARADGSKLVDVDNNTYIDYVGAWGPMILGHQHPDVIAAIQLQLKNGIAYGAPTELETKLAQKICQLMPNIKKVRMVNSGTEATMTAIRLARAITKKNKIIKFTGCYHGHVDSLLVNAGSGALTLGIPSSPGVPEDLANLTLSLDFNNIEQLKHIFLEHHHDIAAVIIEPIAGNMNLIPSDENFLQSLRTLCTDYNSLLIFDEVMTGFRVALGGAQSIYKIKPDLTTLGKIIGGGMPVGAIGGRAEYMEYLAPVGPVYQAGTLSGNPLAMSAGLKTLELISELPDFYADLSTKTEQLINGLQDAAKTHHIELCSQNVGSMFGLYFSEAIPQNYSSVTKCNQHHFIKFFNAMLDKGIYLAPSAFEAGFVSYAHTIEQIEQTIQAAKTVFANW